MVDRQNFIHATSLLLVIFITSCSGQNNTHAQNDEANKTKSDTYGQTKLVKIQGIASGNVGCELQDRAGNIWFSTGGEGVYRYDGKYFTNFTTKDGLCDNNVNVIIEDKAGNILFGTNSGLCRYDGKVFTNFMENNALNKAPVWNVLENAEMSKKRIISLLEDKEGNLWFSTMNSGIYRYDGKTFTNFLNNDDHPFNLGTHDQLIIDILQDKTGHIWFCSWNGGGVWQYDGKNFKNFLPAADYYRSNEDRRSLSNAPQEPFPNAEPNDDLTDDMIFSMSEDKAGNIWFATRRHGACLYDGKTFTNFTENKGFANRCIYAVLEDKTGNIWLTTQDSGVWRYDGKNFKNFTTKEGLINDSVFSILEDKDGNLWFGTRGFGLSRYDGKTFTSFTE